MQPVRSLIFVLAILLTGWVSAQHPVAELSWKKVATGMPDAWYGSEESTKVAENVLLYQRDLGGWPKNTSFHKPLTDQEKSVIRNDKDLQDAIFDNGATTTEMRFLAKMYLKTGTEHYKEAFEKALHFILKAQYESGGWPMFYPLKKGYYTHITFNDDAILNLLSVLKDIALKKPAFAFLKDQETVLRAKRAFDRGIDCILKTQIQVNGQPTVWCAQHDEITFLPAKARAYELPSFSGGESGGLLLLLMEIENPTPRIIRSVMGGVAWLEVHQLKNTRWDAFTNAEGKTDRRIISDPKAGSMWARFYDLETGHPFVCDRDGIPKSNLEEIGHERRNGYSWYITTPQKVLDAYPAWKAKWVK